MNVIATRMVALDNGSLASVKLYNDEKPYYLSYRRRKTRVYVWPQNESILENLMNRHERPYTLYRKEIMPNVVSALDLPYAKWRWSQYAGCGCPCSPGFIIQTEDGYPVSYDGRLVDNISITV